MNWLDIKLQSGKYLTEISTGISKILHDVAIFSLSVFYFLNVAKQPQGGGARRPRSLLSIQRKGARAIFQAPRDAHSTPLLDALRLDSLADRHARHALLLVHNILSGSCHPALADFFDLQQDETLAAPSKSRLKLGAKRFRVIGAEMYNKSLLQD